MVSSVFELFMVLFLTLLVIFGVFAVIIFIYEGVYEAQHCGKWEDKIVHQEAYTQYTFSGKIMVPIRHSAGDYLQKVCTQPK